MLPTDILRLELSAWIALADGQSAEAIQLMTEAAELELEKKGDVLVSKAKLPEGDGYGVVVQLKQTADAKPQNFRFKLETHTCGGCKRAEYACTCDE